MKKMTKICVLLTMVMVLVTGAYQALKIHQKEQRQKEFEELFGGEVKTSEVPISVSHREEQKQEESDVSDEGKLIIHNSPSLTHLDNGGIKVKLSEVEGTLPPHAKDGYCETYNGGRWIVHIEGSVLFIEPADPEFMGYETITE